MFLWKKNWYDSKMAGINRSKQKANTFTHAAVSDVRDLESSEEFFPIATLGESSDVTNLLTLVNCEECTDNASWVSLLVLKRLGSVGKSVILTISGFNSTTVVKTRRDGFTVSSEPNKSNSVFTLCAYLEDKIPIGS